MVRIIIKGGVWKNTEDEVLKAAIAKYGKNQWARISSLLVRKTPKQCKARWYEWLDPSIKKTEWSKTEDEKLLHLAKLMPTQWRTIAPIVGRTATQCLERYQKLLDEAEAKENEELGLTGPGAEAAPSADDVRRLRPGEIDPDPETKPARPDPIDMDEDEKEMLSEARARLANTQGKKAKRKARERQLEEARRLAVLQKKRELKAAGIIMRSKTKKKGMDYNTDIPFEKKPAPGFYDTSDELAKTQNAPIGQSLRRLENRRRPEQDDAKKRQRNGKEEPHSTKFIAARDAQIQKLKEADQIIKRRKLMLPPAQVGEAELEEIVKIGQAGEYARTLVSDGNDATQGLLGEYDGPLEAAKTARTPRTAPQFDNVMAEARNLRHLAQTQTPLLGEENTPLHLAPGAGSGYESATPRHQVAFTPNPLATPLHRNGSDVSATPRSEAVGGTPLRTPLRDSLKINPDDAAMQSSAAKRALALAFDSLPKPANDWEVLVPEEEADADEDAGPLSEEDAAERDARLARTRAEQEQAALARRTQVVQRDLPRPVNVHVDRLLAELPVAVQTSQPEFAGAQTPIDDELVRLLQHDSITHPLPGTVHTGATRSSYLPPPDYDVATAKKLIQSELAGILGLEYPDEGQIAATLAAAPQAADDSLSWAHIRETLAFDAGSQTWTEPESLDPASRVAGMASLLDFDRERMGRDAERLVKQEKKLNVQLGGYQARHKALATRLTTAFESLLKGKIELESFARLSINEQAAAPRRVEALAESVDKLERRERGLQAQYQEMSEQRNELAERVSLLEEQLMEQAEALNEAALEGGDGDDLAMA